MLYARYSSSGNTCLIIDGLSEEEPFSEAIFSPSFVSSILSHPSLESDNLLVVYRFEPSSNVVRSWGFNRDGSKVGMCCNGSRCVGAFVAERVAQERRDFKLVLDDLEVAVRYVGDDISVELPRPSFKREEIPVAPLDAYSEAGLTPITIKGFSSPIYGVFSSLGNPHFSISCLERENLEQPYSLMRELGASTFFPEGMNIEFFWYDEATGLIEARFFERGVGETLSSGTGAAALSLAFHHLHGTEGDLSIECLGGQLGTRFSRDSGLIEVIGPVQFRDHGHFDLEDILSAEGVVNFR